MSSLFFFFFFFTLHKNPLSAFETGLCSWDQPTPFISAHWAHKVIHYCKLVPEPDRTWQRDNWSGSTRLCFLPELCTVADLDWPRNRRKHPPPLLSSLQKAFSQPPSFSFALSCCVSLSVTAPDGLLFSGCSLTSILRVTSFFFFPSSVDLSPADSPSTVNSSLFQLCLQPALWVWWTTLVLSPAADGLLFFVFFPPMHAVFGSHAWQSVCVLIQLLVESHLQWNTAMDFYERLLCDPVVLETL